MHLIAWLYSNREHTDGKLHMPDFRTVAAESQLTEHEALLAADELENCELWRGRLPGAGYELVDFLKWNHTALEISNRAAENLARVQAFRARPKEPRNTEEDYRSTEAQVRTDVRNALQDQDETDEAKQMRLVIAQLAKDKALEFNGQGRLSSGAEDVA